MFKSMSKKVSEEHLNTIIGDGTTFNGVLSVSGSVRIDGKVTGKLDATGHITVGQNGIIESNEIIKCLSAHIAGIIKSDVLAPMRVHLTGTARLIGNITTKVLVIEEGAVFTGKSDMGVE